MYDRFMISVLKLILLSEMKNSGYLPLNMKRREAKLFEFADLDDQEQPMTVKQPWNRNSSEVPPTETTLLTLNGLEKTQLGQSDGVQ